MIKYILLRYVKLSVFTFSRCVLYTIRLGTLHTYIIYGIILVYNTTTLQCDSRAIRTICCVGKQIICITIDVGSVACCDILTSHDK
jgi:hypothetical protein